MGTPRFTPRFHKETFCQITEPGYSIAEVSNRTFLCTSSTSGYRLTAYRDLQEVKSDILKPRAYLKPAEEERIILKNAARCFSKESD